jgi:hypothetical protein
MKAENKHSKTAPETRADLDVDFDCETGPLEGLLELAVKV